MYNFSVSKCVSLQHDYLSEATYKHVIQTAEILGLKRTKKGWRNLMPEIVPIDHGMNDLIELHLKDDSQLRCLVDTTYIGSPELNVFSKLVVLKLKGMINLEELCNGPISFDSLNNLEELSIKNCQHLRKLFRCSLNLCNLTIMTLRKCSNLISVFDTPQSLLLLERLVISDCENLELLYVLDDERCNIMFPKLKVVNIEYCPKLKYIFPHVSSKALLLLETIVIASCGNLKHIFGQHQDVELASLKALSLYRLPNFIGIFPESYHSFEGSSHSISNIVFPKLKELVVIYCVKLEYIFGHINASDHHRQNHLHIPALKCLKFNKLPRLIGMGTRNYHITLIHLLELHLECYFYVANESIGDFVYSISKSQDTTTIKVLYTPSFHIFLLLVKLLVNHFNLKNIIGIKKTLDYCNLM
jgi:hypothetical protein